jgi:CubicO group peptidase (beta-lactamase class C family)
MAGPVLAGAQELEARLASFLAENGLPGAAAGIVHRDELAWSAAIGFADVRVHLATQPATLYRIASITKTVTGTAVMQLRDAGRLDLDDPAVAWLPELVAATSPFGPIETVTIRRMLSHESGLPTEPPGTDWAVPAYQGDPKQTLRQAEEISLRLPPNTRHKYSDLAYQLLGEIVTRASGTPYPQYVREAILDPLGMTATAFEPLPRALHTRRATGYWERSLTDELAPAAAMPPVWAEGGLWSCVADLARWISFQLAAHRDSAPDSAILAAPSLREMHTPRYLEDDEWTRAWGISWWGTHRDDAIWIGHSGGVPGFTTTICFDPRQQVGAIVLINGTCFDTGIGMDLAAIASRLIGAEVPAIRPPAPTPGQYRPLLGIYARAELSWVIRLEWRAGKLTFVSREATAWRLPLAPTADPDVFVVEPGSAQSGDQVIFHRGPDGRVTSVLLADTTLVRLDRVAGSD